MGWRMGVRSVNTIVARGEVRDLKRPRRSTGSLMMRGDVWDRVVGEGRSLRLW